MVKHDTFYIHIGIKQRQAAENAQGGCAARCSDHAHGVTTEAPTPYAIMDVSASSTRRSADNVTVKHCTTRLHLNLA